MLLNILIRNLIAIIDEIFDIVHHVGNSIPFVSVDTPIDIDSMKDQ